MEAQLVLDRAVLTALGLVLLIAGRAKFSNFPQFVATVANYDILPMSTARPFAAAVVAAELGLGISFLLGLWLAITLSGGAVLFLVFFSAAAVNLIRGRHVPCGCFGSTTDLISAGLLVRLVLLLAATLLVLTRQLGHGPAAAVANISPAVAGTAWPVDFALATLAGIGLVLVFLWLLRLPPLFRSRDSVIATN